MSVFATALCAVTSCQGEAAPRTTERPSDGQGTQIEASQVRTGVEGGAASAGTAAAEPSRPAPAGHRLRASPGRRGVDVWLLDALRDAAIRPGLERSQPPTKCFQGAGAKSPPVENAFSTLPPHIKRHNIRLGLTIDLHRRDMRQVLAFRVPRAVTWNVAASRQARLEFAYRVGCRVPRAGVVLEVRVERLGAPEFRTSVSLSSGKQGPGKPWREVAITLPVERGERFALTMRFRPSGAAAENMAVALANPRITGSGQPERGVGHHNVLLVIVDALRGDLVGPDRRTDVPHLTPGLQKLYRQGAYFTRAFAVANQTRASTLAILASQPPSLGGFLTSQWVVGAKMRTSFYPGPTSPGPPLLPLALRSAGYVTATIGHNRFLFPNHPMGLDHGFDRIHDDSHRTLDTARLTDRALEFLDDNAGNRWFLYFNLVTPHLPYRPPKAVAQQVLRATGGEKRPADISADYLAEVAYADQQLGRVFDRLASLGLTEETLVVVMADHGEVFSKPHACWSHRYGQNCHFNHGLTLYGEETHVPLMFVGPSWIKPGTIVRRATTLLNVAPTILDVLGLPSQARHVGRSMRRELAGHDGVDDVIYTESRRAVAIQKGALKLHVHHQKDDAWPPARRGPDGARSPKLGVGLYQLFDLNEDPFETKNLALSGDPRLAGMVKALEEHRVAMARRMSPDAPSSGARGRRSWAPATNVLLLRGDGAPHRLKSTVSVGVGGQLSCGRARGDGTCEQVNPQTIALSLRATAAPAGVVFRSQPWEAPIRIDATLNGERFDPADLRLGPFGIKLLRPGEDLATSVAALDHAAARHPPRLEATGEPGLFYWRSVPVVEPGQGAAVSTKEVGEVKPLPLGPEAISAPDSGEAMSDELRKALKEMGYTR